MSGSDLRLEYEAALARTTAVDLGRSVTQVLVKSVSP
jgi:hypothetical protein